VLKANVAAAGPSIGGAGEPPSDWNSDLLKSTNFDFSRDWLAVYIKEITASVTIDGECTPDQATGLCEIDILKDESTSTFGIEVRMPLPVRIVRKLTLHMLSRNSQSNSTTQALPPSSTSTLRLVCHPEANQGQRSNPFMCSSSSTLACKTL